MSSIKILGTRVDKVDMMGALCRIQSYINEGTFHHVITLNAEIIYAAQFEDSLLNLINTADMVTPDGSGVVWASGYLNDPVPERVTGIDLMMEICKQAHHNDWKIFMLGGAPGVPDQAAESLRNLYPHINIVGVQHGYFKEAEENEILHKIEAAQPDILFAALGAPRQEFWIRKNRNNLPVSVAMGVGGSFDVVSGKVKRAPLWMQKMKLEWLARLIKEPWRYKRMMALPKFVLRVALSKSEKNIIPDKPQKRLP